MPSGGQRRCRLADELLARCVDQLLALEPDSIAVLLTGSHGRGNASPTSDLDLTAITAREPRVPYRTWFAPRADASPLHVSTAATTATGWLDRTRTPARWALGFPSITEARYLWAAQEPRALIGEPPSLRRPAAAPQLEDFVDFVLKAKRSAVDDDRLGLRWSAHAAGLLAPGHLIASNPMRVVTDRRDALDAALALRVAPPHYRQDLGVCLGLTPSTAAAVRRAVARLGAELLAFLREHTPGVDPQPELARYLSDGTLQRHLELIE
jgi:phosphoribosyl-AMP cyclohydrolase